MADEVMEALWRIKDDMARGYGYDIARLAADLQGRQGKDRRRIVNFQALRHDAAREASAGRDS